MRIFALLVAMFFFAVIAGADEQAPAAPQFTLTSPSFKDGATIPDAYTCRGANISPALEIANIPAGSKSMALTVHDPDGAVGVWVHWVVFNISPKMSRIGEREVPGTQALNDFGNFYYGGPCPPDQKVHHYVFTLYALNAFLDSVNEGATKDVLERAIKGKVIAKAELTGIYQNLNWK
jgi:Raf kinase inhibitor-like YbhB/YbcL family protein